MVTCLLVADWVAPQVTQALRATANGMFLVAVGAGLGVLVLTDLLLAPPLGDAAHRAVQVIRRLGAGRYGERLQPAALAPLDDDRQFSGALNDLAAALQGAEQRRVDLLGAWPMNCAARWRSWSVTWKGCSMAM